MISLFRRLNPLNVLMLVITAVILRSGILLNPPENIDFKLFDSYIAALLNLPAANAFSVQINLFLALLITLIQSLYFNKVVNEYNLLGKASFLPALMYITGSGLLLHFLVLSPALLCNFLGIWMLEKFLSVHRKESAQSTMFDLGIIVGLGVLIYTPFITMMLLLWICLIIFRPFIWREWVVSIIGFLMVYFFIAVAYYLTDSYEKLRNFNVPLALEFKLFQINIYDYLVLIPLLLILFLSVITLQQKLYRSYIHIRKAYLMLFFMLIFTLLSFFLSPGYQIYHFLLAIPPVAVFMGYYFTFASKAWFYESIYLVLAGFIIYFQFV